MKTLIELNDNQANILNMLAAQWNTTRVGAVRKLCDLMNDIDMSKFNILVYDKHHLHSIYEDGRINNISKEVDDLDIHITVNNNMCIESKINTTIIK